MSFQGFETGVESAAPIELYAFAVLGTYYRYTNHTAAWGNYQPAPITRERVERSVDVTASQLKITVPQTLSIIADVFSSYPPPTVVAVTVFKVHPADGNAVSLWAGRVLGVEFAGAEAVLQCESIFSSLRRVGVRRRISRHCPHVLYESPCSATKTGTTATVAIAGNPLTLTASQGTSFAGGTLKFGDEQRLVLSNSGTQVTLAWPVTAQPGQQVTLYRGCDHTLTGCASHNNTLNYGGFPYMPRIDPYTTQIW